jgi:hypothetical protein
VPSLIDFRQSAGAGSSVRRRAVVTAWQVGFALILSGCGEPSVRELRNRRELEALLTAISLRNTNELDRDIQRIEDRHASGELSAESYDLLQQIAKKAKNGDWGEAEKEAYALRESKPFFR